MDNIRPCGEGNPPEPDRARERLIEEHLYLVTALARKIKRSLPNHVPIEDLEGYGRLGLVESASRFDPGRGVLFKTFAYYRIRGAILDGVRKLAWFASEPIGHVTFEASANAALEDMASEDTPLSGSPSLEDRIARVKVVVNETVVARLLAPGPDPLEQTEVNQAKALVRDLLSGLEDKERLLVEDYYFRNMTLEEAGERLGLSKSWACRLHARALQKLHKMCQSARLASNPGG